MDLTELSLFEAAALLSARKLSPTELVQAYIARIEALDPYLNSFISFTPDLALAAARQAEDEIGRGGYRGLLHGIPIALKDLYETRQVKTTAGSRVFAGYMPERDGFVVERLLSAGAVLLGKLNMHEIALGITNQNPHYGDCRNPWDVRRMSGGSSGGSGAALAARLCLGSMGSDTGGSIRIPASLCGVVGLKPTYGRISLRGVIPLSWNLDHAGPMARQVRDAALLLQVCAGYDPADPASAPVPVDDYLAAVDGAAGDNNLAGLRVALAVDDFFTQAEPAVLMAVRDAAGVFAQLGAQVEEAVFPDGLTAARTNGMLVTSDAAAFHRERLAVQPGDFGVDVLERLQGGAALTSTEYSLARRTQVELRRRFELFFEEWDLLLAPSTPVTAPFREGENPVARAPQLTRFTAPFNLTGLPALSLPCGFDEHNLPVGLQITGRPWSEALLLKAAHAYEQAAGWVNRQPSLPPG